MFVWVIQSFLLLEKHTGLTMKNLSFSCFSTAIPYHLRLSLSEGIMSHCLVFKNTLWLADVSLKTKQNKSSHVFWSGIGIRHPVVSETALNILLLFCDMCFCEDLVLALYKTTTLISTGKHRSCCEPTVPDS